MESDRLQSLLAGISLVDDQSPSLFVLVGSSCKALVVQELVSAKSIRSTCGRRTQGEMHLHLEPLSAFSKQPIYIADSDLRETPTGQGTDSSPFKRRWIRTYASG